MRNKRFDEFTYIFLVNASQMAYIEDAQKTHAMLQKFNELYRYMIKDDCTTMLKDELKSLLNYIAIQTDRYESRFKIIIKNNLTNNDIYIKHLCLLDFIDNIMNNALSRYESFFNMNVELNCEPQLCMTATLDSGGQSEVFNIVITEEGK